MERSPPTVSPGLLEPSSGSPSLLDDNEFWYKLKVDYDEVKVRESDLLTNLVSQFFHGKKSHVEEAVGNVETFLQGIHSLDDQKLRTLLLRIYVNHLWDQNKSGQFFACADVDLRNELSRSFAEMRV